MNIFFILVGISFVGILGVFWLLKNEDKPSLHDLVAPTTAAPPRIKKVPLWAGLFTKFKSREKASPQEVITGVPAPGATDFAEKSFAVYQDNLESASSAPGVALSADEEKKIEQEIDLTAQLEEWNGKYERLDKLFKEKSAALEKAEESLRNELNNRKEFNKVKDILEKELREAKDKARNIHTELSAAKAEAEGNKKRTNQLEEKVTKLEKALLGKDDEITALAKRLEAAARAPAAAAAATSEPDVKTPSSGSLAVPPADPEASTQPVAAPQQVVSAEPPVVPSPQMPEVEQGKSGEEQTPSTEEGFLKIQPDILAAPEANPQDPQDKLSAEGQINKNKDEQKE